MTWRLFGPVIVFAAFIEPAMVVVTVVVDVVDVAVTVVVAVVDVVVTVVVVGWMMSWQWWFPTQPLPYLESVQKLYILYLFLRKIIYWLV